MIRRLGKFLLAGLAVLPIVSVVCQAQAQRAMTRHVREVTQDGRAQSAGRLPAAQVVRIVLVLPLRHEPELQNFIQRLYDPSNSSSRYFLSVDEFTARFGPSQEDYDALIRFAEANGLIVVGTSRNRLDLDVEAPVANIEKALHLTMGVYQHPTENRTFYAPDREPTLDLPFPLWRIAGLDNYSIPHPLYSHQNSNAKSNATFGSGPGASFLGSDMRVAYYGGSLTGHGQSLGLLEYYGTDLADLDTYYRNVGQTESVPVTVLSTDGTPTSCYFSKGCDDTEQTLDMTQALGMAPGMSNLVMYVGSTDAAIFNAMATASPLNNQLSSSWSWSPADPNTDDPYFEEFAAQGQSLFQAAGDEAAWGLLTSDVFPSDDDYVTSVGGTDLTTASQGGPWSSETGWTYSGGGISPDNFAIPSWQVATASGCSDCSQTYRNGPDVAANANWTFYVCADQIPCTENEYGGTSFAAPMWAGYMALINQQASANGNPVVGFVNLALYDIGLSANYNTDLHDITSGDNGFSATTGYDLNTGWGSPNGSGLITALAGAGVPSIELSASPSSVTVARGNSGAVTITTTVTGSFDSKIALSGKGTGTRSFSPRQIAAPGNGTSTMTIKVGDKAPLGNHTITITAKGGGTTQTTTVTLDVTR